MIRILVVEDFAGFRTLVSVILRTQAQLEVVISEVSDGLDAVAKARDLTPDVILMDIGLPKLNGLEAARQIRELVPSSKIVFLTQETGVESIKAAFKMGAWGYISKLHTHRDLVAALTAILQCKRFVSSGLLTESHMDEQQLGSLLI